MDIEVEVTKELCMHKEDWSLVSKKCQGLGRFRAHHSFHLQPCYRGARSVTNPHLLNEFDISKGNSKSCKRSTPKDGDSLQWISRRLPHTHITTCVENYSPLAT
ncbi:hypothetical protein GOP47_0009346 [Adiantum capillus-veneris]|uniref:Uncharacterized protein n=1 Tax=Adiantum capillus-veneris TaxID=13818 RepID=A0A9D4UW16_ADICA|nr:hypothetical protein GOP47_0009346 [Adiantum capillus-veneris]